MVEAFAGLIGEVFEEELDARNRVKLTIFLTER
jgi:hypothetical protein